MAKASRLLGSLFTLFFTSVLAPVLIHALSEACDGTAGAGHARIPQAAPAAAAPAATGEERVVAEGTGATPEEAWYDAQRAALGTAVTPMVDARTWAREYPLIWAALRRDQGRLITRCEDLGAVREREVWRRGVVVFVARAAVAATLKAARVPVIAGATP
jgi:hypothetical protein